VEHHFRVKRRYGAWRWLGGGWRYQRDHYRQHLRHHGGFANLFLNPGYERDLRYFGNTNHGRLRRAGRAVGIVVVWTGYCG